MVGISLESPDQIERRLLRVIKSAELTVYEGAYAFREYPLADFPAMADPRALAVVRDDEVWSELAVAGPDAADQFRIFRFHFPADVDNSGFVGWLASRLKSRFGTGVFVTCGQNSGRGGIFDYWGVPAHVGSEVIAAVRELAAGP